MNYSYGDTEVVGFTPVLGVFVSELLLLCYGNLEVAGLTTVLSVFVSELSCFAMVSNRSQVSPRVRRFCD